ncbi:hypothetical protein AALT_g10790 [Alternaria alternata]|nr:hypothetical protein AALT_g10790 [Alternaria alternata]
MEPDDNLSDIELYEEARLATKEGIQRRIIIIGKDAKEIRQEAMRQQPYFNNKEAKVSDQEAPKEEDTKEHKKLY